MPKPTNEFFDDIDSMLKFASIFHGHLGPLMVLGLKAGLLAINEFGRNPFKLRAIVETKGFTPTSCFIDGIQFSTSCTLGKGNIEAKSGDNILVKFVFDNKYALEIKVKDNIIKEIQGNFPDEVVEDLARKVAKMDYDELFEIKRYKVG